MVRGVCGIRARDPEGFLEGVGHQFLARLLDIALEGGQWVRRIYDRIEMQVFLNLERFQC